ncbi:MAG: esterase [Thermomicrobiales bacterium]|nr:esterase [Thermomicrobiales bacterium]
MHLDTTIGPLPLPERGCILPHEHVFVDLRTSDQPGYAEADPEAVVHLMAPEIRAAGVVAIVEPGGIGVGRRVDILLAVSRATWFPLVAPTGVYREPWLPPWVREASETDLAEWMKRELTSEIEETGVRAGWIKVGASDEGLTAAEAKVLRAAADASFETVATAGSHTLNGPVARNQVDTFEEAGGSPGRFVWIHAHREPDIAIHHELGRRGIWLEYDGIGQPGTDQMFVDLVHRGLDAGLDGRILLSHDRGWYDPAQLDGGTPLPYTYLTERFLPLLSDVGIDDATIDRLTRLNPFAAFARP